MRARRSALRLEDFPLVRDPEFGVCVVWEAIEDTMLPELWEQFSVWINGQTCGVLPDGSIVVYGADLERFLDGRPVID